MLRLLRAVRPAVISPTGVRSVQALPRRSFSEAPAAAEAPGVASGTADQLQGVKVRILRPSRTATQQGVGGTCDNGAAYGVGACL